MPLGLGSDNRTVTRDNRDNYQSNESENDASEEDDEEGAILEQPASVKMAPRPPRYPRPHSHLFFNPKTGRMLRGKKHAQRYRNSLYLTTLFPLTEEELAEDYGKVVPEYQSAFTDVLTDNHKQLLWENFTKLSEEQQRDVLKPKRRSSCSGSKRTKSTAVRRDEKRKGLERIDPNIRGALFRERQSSKSFLESIETELYEYFAEDPSAIIVYIQLTSYHRMLVHAVCQYNYYVSKTYHIDRTTSYITVGCNELTPPPISLFKLLQDRQ